MIPYPDQFKNSKKTLRDEIAISLPIEAFPTAGVSPVSIFLNISPPDNNDIVSQLNWRLEMEVAYRYKYANMMLAKRNL